MKKISLTFCLALLSSLFCPAQVSPLQFNKNGEFKIVQFTDIHFKYGNPASDIALKRIGEVLDAERPDLAYIIHSGFISGYQNRYGDNLKPPTNVYHRMTA